METDNTIIINLDKKEYNKYDILSTGDCRLQVIKKPRRKWYKLLLQLITFNRYKAPHQYKCRILHTPN